MPWKRPMLPRQLTKGFITSGFGRIRKRELGITVSNYFEQLNTLYRTTQWMKIEFRSLSRFKVIDRFDKDSFDQIFNEAREFVANDCAALLEQCNQARDQVLEIEKSEEDEAAKKLLLEIAEQAELFSQSLSKEVMDTHIKETYDQHMDFLNKQLEQHFERLKNGIVRIVEDIKKVAELNFDASAETAKVAGAITFGYIGIQSFIKNYSKYLEIGLGDISIETFKKDLEPLTKFSEDKSLFAFDSYSDFYERDTKAIISEESDSEDVKKHCIKILQAVRSLPSKYKE